ncbi:MAG TPA: hypothetical protein VES20_19670 [Bryobacteraceae bacterium]|nr:hypothetical protein [Bryobacteraceae bacterium]
MNALAVNADEKRRALQDLLNSATLRRAEQLRRFLEFVVEEEIGGRGPQIREADIAVRALQRPASYTPESDSIVRTRAHALRQRLAEYYRLEAPSAEIRIELPKGGYTPRFVRAQDSALPELIAEPPVFISAGLPEPPLSDAPPASHAQPWLWTILALVAGITLGVLVTLVMGDRGVVRSSSRIETSPELADAWSPMLESKSTVRVILSSPFQLWVRDYRSLPPPLLDPPETPPLQPDEAILQQYREHWPWFPDSRLYLHANAAGALWGDAAGVQVATRFLSERGVRVELTPERALKSRYVLRNDSILAFGRSEYSPVMANRIPDHGFDVQYLPAIRRHVIARKTNPEQGPKFVPGVGSDKLNYGLVTILRDTTDDGQVCQSMFFSGAISNGAQAAVEFVTTPRLMKELADRLKASGLKRWPRGLQVVVRTETADFYPIRTAYQTHLILQP